MGKIIEGVWDCQYCGADKIRGSLRECPACGHPRDEGVRFYIDNPKNYVSDETAKTLNKNPDWLCEYCSCLNSDNDTVCKGCGMARDSNTKNYFDMHREKAEQQEKVVNFEFDTVPDEGDTLGFEVRDKVVPTPVTQKKSLPWKKIAKYGIMCLVILGIIAGITALFIPREYEGVVDGFNWERVIEVEEYKTVREDGWDIPVGGREVSSEQRIRTYNKVQVGTETSTATREVIDHYETVVTGYRDLGNGYFEEITTQQPVYRTETYTVEVPVYENVPVYDTYYTWDIDKWVHKSNEKTSGSDKNPVWAKLTLNTNEREGAKSEVYEVTITDNEGERHTFKLTFDEWNSLNKGDSVKIKSNLVGSASLIIGE